MAATPRVASPAELVKVDSIDPEIIEGVNSSLIKYALNTLESSISETQTYGNNIVPNICVSPLLLTKAWAYLSNMASGKTKSELQKAVNQMLGQSSFAESDRIIHHYDPVGGVVRFFADYPKELIPDEDADHSGIYQNCKMARLVFKVDQTGSRSIHQINLEFAQSTQGRIRYVVREANPPHWRSVTVLASAADSSFYWKHAAPAKDNFMSFKNGSLLSKVACWQIEDVFYFKNSADAKVLELESHDENSSLILVQFTDPARHLDFETMNEIMGTVEKKRNEHKKKVKLILPRVSSATPIFACRNDEIYKTKRVFDREKSDLSGFLSKSSTKVSSIRTLWNHYHKIVFQIVDGRKEEKPVNPEEEQVLLRQDWLGFAEEKNKKKKAYENVTESIGAKYYEEYLNVQKCCANAQVIESKEDSVAFNTPFYFIHAKKVERGNGPFVLSIGKFTNGDVDNWKNQEA